MPRPALVSTTTSCPAAVNSATEAGVNPTLNSLFLISFGTPTRIFKSFFKAEPDLATLPGAHRSPRSEEHTSELQSLMRISYAVFCLKKKNNTNTTTTQKTNPTTSQSKTS